MISNIYSKHMHIPMHDYIHYIYVLPELLHHIMYEATYMNNF